MNSGRYVTEKRDYFGLPAYTGLAYSLKLTWLPRRAIFQTCSKPPSSAKPYTMRTAMAARRTILWKASV